MSSDEDDYMSEAFLSKCEDTRPGLVPKHIARQHKQQAKQKELNEVNKIKPKKVLEKEKREEGLSKTIGAENKGFAMLQKMGFKPGMTLGKKGEGRSEPVPIEVKSGRSGLGHATKLYRKRTAVSAARILSVQKRQKLEENRQLDFRERQRTAFVEKRAERDLYKSQKVCEQLDAQKNIKEPSELFFWPAAYLQKSEPDVEEEGQEDEDDEESEDDPLTAAEKLEILTLYLRNVHVYCVWCGTSYNDLCIFISDKADMEGNCPGDTAEVHDD